LKSLFFEGSRYCDDAFRVMIDIQIRSLYVNLSQIRFKITVLPKALYDYDRAAPCLFVSSSKWLMSDQDQKLVGRIRSVNY